MFKLGRALLTAAVGLGLTACTAPVLPLPVQQPAGQPHFTIDARAAVGALANKPNQTWQDQVFNLPAVRAARPRQARYHAASVGVTWSLGTSACSNAPAYAKVNNQNTTGPNPQAGDFLYMVSDNGTVQRINPATKAATSASLGATFTRTAVQLSGDNKRMYLMSASGTLYIVDTATLTTLWSAQISSAGFAGQMPCIDYSNGGGFPLGSDEHLYAVSTDGSLYEVHVTTASGLTVAVHAYTSSNGTDRSAGLGAWATKVDIPFGAALTAGASPIAWNNSAYFGSSTGAFYRVTVNPSSPATPPVLTSWNLSQYTSGPAPAGAGCSAPCALDFDASLNVIAIFAPVGDRVCWIDPASNAVYDSPPLVVDKVPSFASQYYGALSSFPYTTSSTAYTTFDWASVAKASNPTPTRWGSGGAIAGLFSTGISCATVKKEPATGGVWVGQQTTPGVVQSLTAMGSVNGTYTSSAANANEICFDPSGNCYTAHNSSQLVAKFNAAGALTTSYTYPGANALWPESDPSGNLWVTGQNSTVTKFDASGNVLFTKGVSNPFCVAVDSGGNALVSEFPGNAVVKYDPNGNVLGTFTVGQDPSYVGIEPSNNNIWTPNYSANTVTKLDPTGVTIGTYPVPANPWCVTFDPDGNPWVGCLGAAVVVKLDASTGGILESYAIPGGGQPFELNFDGNGDCWVAASNGLYKLYDLGNLSDLFSSANFGTAGDGDDSLSLLKFRVPQGAYAGKVPVGSTITLTSATTPSAASGTTEAYSFFRTSPNLSSAATSWIGWGGAINVDYNSRPSLYDPYAYGTSSVTPTKDTSQTFTLGVKHPVDALNSSDPSNSVYSYGFQAATKVLKRVSHWYSNSSAPGAAQKPTLTVTLASSATLPTTNGIQAWPCVDSANGRIYVMGSNCLFELPYNAASPQDFSNPAKVAYSLTKAGRTGGPVSSSKYVLPRANVMQNEFGEVFTVDQDAGSGKLYVNRYNTPFYPSPTAEHLAASFDASPGAGTLGQAMLFDFDRGSVYFTTSSNQLIRGSLY